MWFTTWNIMHIQDQCSFHSEENQTEVCKWENVNETRRYRKGVTAEIKISKIRIDRETH